MGQPEHAPAAAYTEADRQEQARTEAVHALGLLAQPVSSGIEKVVALAAELCQSENATINIVDEEWLHSIAAVGGPKGSWPREDIPCDIVIRSGSELVVEDATKVPILAHSPLVDGTMGRIGFYASVPLRTVSGHVVGTLCAWDERPQTIADGQVKMLRILADHAIGIFQMGDALERARHATDRLAEQSTRAHDLLLARRAAEELFAATFHHASDGIIVLAVSGPDAGRIVRANAAAGTISGRTELAGLTLAEVLDGPPAPGEPTAGRKIQIEDGSGRPGARQPDDAKRQALIAEIALLISEPKGVFRNDTLEHLTRMPVGTGHIYIQLVVTLTRDDQDRPQHILVQMRDVTARQAHEQWLVRQTQTDPLTGLGNRLAMQERLAEEIMALRAPGAGLGVLMIDLDNFKAVNDRLGHPAGDDLLCRMADAMVTILPLDAFAARLGGDEFVVLAPGSSPEVVQETADQVSRALTETAEYFGERLGTQVGASIGLIYTQNPATDPEELLKAADAAMYDNKRLRRYTAPSAQPSVQAPLYAVPSPRDADPIVYPTPTPAPRHSPTLPGETQHPAHSREQ
nr:diguanylate cyclase [Kineosporia babensis]